VVLGRVRIVAASAEPLLGETLTDGGRGDGTGFLVGAKVSTTTGPNETNGVIDTEASADPGDIVAAFCVNVAAKDPDDTL
jgi:hypothetical protein